MMKDEICQQHHTLTAVTAELALMGLMIGIQIMIKLVRCSDFRSQQQSQCHRNDGEQTLAIGLG